MVVTGGQDRRGKSLKTVAQFTETGDMTFMKRLKTRRHSHACSKFVNSDGVTVSEGVRCRNQESVECVWCDLVHIPGNGGCKYSHVRK